MAATIDLNEAPPLARLLEMIQDTDEILITEAGTPVARLVAIPSTARTDDRIPGLHDGMGWISDDFDDPLPEEFWLGTE